MLAGSVFALVMAGAVCAPIGRAIVSEVVYDAIGDDTGHEFVELFNPTPQPVPLAGVRLEAGDGSGPGRWSLRWTGTADDTVAAFARFVVGGALVVPAPDAIATLELQNGPDALRIVWPDGASEVVGWGAHEFAEYACGAPAADVASGRSLARVPDDADLGGNALDFRAADPSPGRANQLGRDVALAKGSLALAPESPGPGERARLALRIENRGRDALAAGDVLVRAEGGALAAPLETTLADALPAGEGATVAFDVVAGAAGRGVVVARVELAGDEAVGNDADTLLVQIGPGALEVTEIQFHPAAGEGEWVELRNRSGVPVALAAFSLADRTGTPGAPQTGTWLAPDSLAVFAQDRSALLASAPGLDTTRVVAVRPWAALNNTNDSTGIADVVTLRDADRVLVARVPYAASGVPAGVPIEWSDGAWRPGPSAAGTPLSPPRARPALGGTLRVTPAHVRAGDAELLAAWQLPWPRGRVSLELYDLAGRRVAVLARDVDSAARDERSLSPRSLRPGLYVVALRALAWSGGESMTAAQPLRVDEARR